MQYFSLNIKNRGKNKQDYLMKKRAYELKDKFKKNWNDFKEDLSSLDIQIEKQMDFLSTEDIEKIEKFYNKDSDKKATKEKKGDSFKAQKKLKDDVDLQVIKKRPKKKKEEPPAGEGNADAAKEKEAEPSKKKVTPTKKKVVRKVKKVVKTPAPKEEKEEAHIEKPATSATDAPGETTPTPTAEAPPVEVKPEQEAAVEEKGVSENTEQEEIPAAKEEVVKEVAVPTEEDGEKKVEAKDKKKKQVKKTKEETQEDLEEVKDKKSSKGIIIQRSKKTAPKEGETFKKPVFSKDKGKRYKKVDKLEEKEKEIHRSGKSKSQKHTIPKTISIPKSIDIMETITVAELAKKMNIKVNDLIAKFISMGEMVTINQLIDAETATLIASEFGCETNIISLYDETVIEEEEDKAEDLENRPPIVTIMGHVDHGKTKLLDAIRQSNIVDTEAGGITQHIGAYVINKEDHQITFLDTPGHEAFTAMRARGAHVTDIVVLVVAADDGVMPQTIEAINHAKAAGVPLVVAINKIDMEKANPDRVLQGLADQNILVEEWGGNIQSVQISAKQKINIDKLLEAIILESEVLELKANPNKRAVGAVIESRIDKGKGVVATILIQNGTLRLGDRFVCGIHSGRVRAMFNDKGQSIEEAAPSIPVEILGLAGVPEAGDPFHVMETEKQSKIISQKRKELKRVENAKQTQKVSKLNFMDVIKDGQVTSLRLVVKADVQGSVEALCDSFTKLSTDEVKVNVLHSGTGAISESDVNLASASEAVIVGFHVRPNTKANDLANRLKVEVRKYSIIYDAIDDIKALVEGKKQPELKEEITGTAQIREVFKVPKVGMIAGCYVSEGTVHRNDKLRLYREGEVIFDGAVGSLKRFKEDVNDVKQGYECGIMITDFQDVKVGDIIETFIIKEIPVASTS